MVYVGFLEIKMAKKQEDVIKKWTAAAKAWKKTHPGCGTWRLYGRIMGVGPKPMYMAILELPGSGILDEFSKTYSKDDKLRKAEDDWSQMIDEFQASIMNLLSEVE
jgi:hypothetical protein